MSVPSPFLTNPPSETILPQRLNEQERISKEFEDRVAGVMRRLGFQVHQRFELPLTPNLCRELDLLCFSDEYEKECDTCCELEGGDEDVAASPAIQRFRRVVWVESKMKHNGGRVGVHVLWSLFGAFSYLMMSSPQNQYLPSQIWVVTNGRFSGAARRFAEATRGLFREGCEFFVLVDRRGLEKFGGGRVA